MIAIDYFTKWGEAKALTTIVVKKMVQLCYKNIVCWTGIPYKIVSNNGLQFDCNEFQKLCDDLEIKKGFFTVINRQTNGQVEAINKTLK